MQAEANLTAKARCDAALARSGVENLVVTDQTKTNDKPDPAAPVCTLTSCRA